MPDMTFSAPLISWNQMQERSLSAIVGATLVSLTVTPLEVVKVRIQAQSERYVFCGHLLDRVKVCSICLPKQSVLINGTIDGMCKIFANEGLLSLYRGLMPTMLMSVPATVVYFVGYECLKDQMHSKLGCRQDDWSVPLLSGSMARIIAATTISPLELLKTRMQHQGRDGTIVRQLGDLFSLIKASGPTILFRGLIPTLARDVPFSGIYWTFYEMFKRSLQGSRSGEASSGFNEFSCSFVSGALAGSIAATLTIPFDVVKTRHQVSLSNGLLASYSLPLQLKSIWREEGMAGLTKGLIPRIGKVSPACAIMISSYEMGKRLLSASEQQT